MNSRFHPMLLAVLPFVAAILMRLGRAEPTPPTPGHPPASLAFDQYLVNLREAPLLPVLWGDFHFSNTGDQPLSIIELKPSCGCLQPLLAGEKRTYQPGERGLFRVQIATANESPGPHAYDVRVRYSDPEPHETRVRFKVRLPQRKLSVEPAELAFFQYNGQSASQLIHVTDFRDTSLQVLNVTSSSRFVTARIQPADRDEAGNHRVPIELSVPGRVPPGRQVATVTIETNDPEFATIRVPILIDGPSAPTGAIQMIGHETPAVAPHPDGAERKTPDAR